MSTVEHATTVLVADDQILISQAVTDILTTGGITVVGEASNGIEAVTQTRELKPDVVLMDIRMPEMDGIKATTIICSDTANNTTRVLILTTFEEDDYVVGALRAEASGFIGKGAEPDEITRAVRSVHAGDALLSPAATRSLIARCVATPPPGGGHKIPPEIAFLTEREREVLTLVGTGLSNQEIATRFVISPHTVKTHVNRIMAKLYAHDRAQLVIFAYESGLVVPGT